MPQRGTPPSATGNRPTPPAYALVEHLFRHQTGRMLSTLSRIFGLENLDLAEEVVQEALLQALRRWPYQGVPENPTAWLVQAARNKALDVLRRRSALRRKAEKAGFFRNPRSANLLQTDNDLESLGPRQDFQALRKRVLEQTRDSKR